MSGICGYNWSQLKFLHPCHKLEVHQEGTPYSRLLCYPTGAQAVCVKVSLPQNVWCMVVIRISSLRLRCAKFKTCKELQIMVAKMDKQFWREGKRSTIWMMEDFTLTKKVPCRVILPTNHKSATRYPSMWFSIWTVFRLTGDLTAIEISFL